MNREKHQHPYITVEDGTVWVTEDGTVIIEAAIDAEVRIADDPEGPTICYVYEYLNTPGVICRDPFTRRNYKDDVTVGVSA